MFPLPRGIHHSYPWADSCRHGRRLWGCLVGVESAGGLWVMGSEVQLGPLGLGAGSWGPDGGRRLIGTAWGSNQRAQGLLAALRVCLPDTASCCHLLGTPTVGCGVRMVIFGVQVTRGEVQLGALQVRMVEGRSAWQLLGALAGAVSISPALLCPMVLLCRVHQSCSALSISPAVPCPSVALCCVHQSHCAVSVSPTVPSVHTQPGAVGGPAGKPLTGLLRRSEMVLHSRQRPRWRSVLGGSHGRHFGPAARTGAGRCCSGAVAALTPQHSPQRW